MRRWKLGCAVKTGLTTCIAGVVVLFVTQRGNSADEVIAPDDNANMAGTSFSVLVADYATVPEVQAQIATDTVKKQHAEMGQQLYAQLVKEDLPSYAKAEVITLLGYLRYHQATYELIKHINFNYISFRGRPAGSRRIVINPLKHMRIMGFPARNALRAIGPIATQTIYEIIHSKNTDRPTSFNESQVDGFIEVLQGVEGTRWALLKLETLQAEATDPEIKTRYTMLIKRYKEVYQM